MTQEELAELLGFKPHIIAMIYAWSERQTRKAVLDALRVPA